jgi:hypothetical protein
MEELEMEELSNDRPTTPEFRPMRTNHIVSVDLGQSLDYTAIAVLQHCTGINDAGSPYEQHTGQTTGTKLQTKAERFRVVHLERLPLGTHYARQVDHVSQMMARKPLCGDENQKPAQLVIDAGGVGRGIFDFFTKAGFTKAIAITITGGGESSCHGPFRYNVSKHELVTGLDALLHHPDNPLKFSIHLTESHALAEELRDFERHVGAAGRNTYEARSGKNDDLVMSVAMACWWATRPKPQPAGWGTYSRTVPPNATYGYGN